MNKICKCCGYKKAVAEFSNNKNTSDGKSNTCKQCKNYQAKQKRNEEKMMMHRLKYNGCAICGYDKCFRALEFHHVNPVDKDFCICISHRKSDTKIAGELNKCILVCSNCHREIEDN